MPEKTRVLCFGDSLTWGWVPVPDAMPSERYPYAERWPGIMANELGDQYEIIEEGLSGRTTNATDPLDSRLNGAAYLPAALASHLPLDLVIIMLGTNDSKVRYQRSVHDIATGMEQLVTQVQTSAGGVGTTYPAPEVLVVAPPPLGTISHPWFADVFEGGHEKTRGLAAAYEHLALFYGTGFCDAGQVTETGGVDGIHLTAENNAALGQTIAAAVQRRPSAKE